MPFSTEAIMKRDYTMCPVCGAYSRRSCEMEDELGVCPWEESGQMDEDLERAKQEEEDAD